MESDIGIIDQQNNSVGTIPRYNLVTFNPPQNVENIKKYYNNLDYGLINQSANRVGVVDPVNLLNFNPPLGTSCKKIVMAETYYEMDYNDKNKPYFWHNQKIPSTNEN